MISYPIEGKRYCLRIAAGVAEVTVTGRVWEDVGRGKRRLYVTLLEAPGVLLPYEQLFAAWDYALDAEPVSGLDDLPLVTRDEAQSVDDLWLWRRENGIPNV